MANELIKITDLTVRLGLSSRSLRYYDTENIERLKQIIVLRNMQIPAAPYVSKTIATQWFSDKLWWT